MFAIVAAVLLIGQISGNVVSITDGDTIIVRPEQGASGKVRLIHIDAPECGQAFGTRARQSLDVPTGAMGEEIA